MRVAIVSPHLDDAIFSVAEHMLSKPCDEYLIVCPFAAIPTDDAGRAKYERLLAEHAAVVSSLRERGIDAAELNGPFLDDVYGAQNADQIAEWFLDELKNEEIAELWSPVGIYHPDHLLAAYVTGKGLAKRLGTRWAAYEELPYRVLYPSDALLRLPEGCEMRGYDPSHLEAKKELCRMYESQIGPDLERDLYVFERLWSPR